MPRCSASQFERDDADAVLDGVRARGREQRTGGEAVDLRRRRARRRRSRASAVSSAIAPSGAAGVPLHLAVRVPDDRDLVGAPTPPAHVDAQARTRAPTKPGGEVLERDRRRDRRWCSDGVGPSSRRPIVRRSACSSSSTSTSTNGRSSSKPGRNDWCIDRPRPHGAAPADRHEREVGSVLWQCGHTMSGGIENMPQREHRATVEHVLGRGAPSNGARALVGHREPVERSPRSRDHARPPAARRSRPTCTRARAGSARSARRARARAAARVVRSSNCTGTVGSRYAGSPSTTTSPM